MAVLADGTLQALDDVPTLTLKSVRGPEARLQHPCLVALLAPYSGPQSHVLIEESQAIPGQGVRSI